MPIHWYKLMLSPLWWTNLGKNLQTYCDSECSTFCRNSKVNPAFLTYPVKSFGWECMLDDVDVWFDPAVQACFGWTYIEVTGNFCELSDKIEKRHRNLVKNMIVMIGVRAATILYDYVKTDPTIKLLYLTNCIRRRCYRYWRESADTDMNIQNGTTMSKSSATQSRKRSWYAFADCSRLYWCVRNDMQCVRKSFDKNRKQQTHSNRIKKQK